MGNGERMGAVGKVARTDLGGFFFWEVSYIFLSVSG